MEGKETKPTPELAPQEKIEAMFWTEDEVQVVANLLSGKAPQTAKNNERAELWGSVRLNTDIGDGSIDALTLAAREVLGSSPAEANNPLTSRTMITARTNTHTPPRNAT